jgi:cytochrome b561
MGLASLSLREAALYLHWFGPWVYYALPFQLVFFVTGMLSYRLSQFLRISGLKLSLIFWLVVCAEIFMGSFSRVGWLLFVTLPIALPFIFQLTKRSRLDELIGQLSYPLYVCHLFVVLSAWHGERLAGDAWQPLGLDRLTRCDAPNRAIKGAAGLDGAPAPS